MRTARPRVRSATRPDPNSRRLSKPRLPGTFLRIPRARPSSRAPAVRLVGTGPALAPPDPRVSRAGSSKFVTSSTTPVARSRKQALVPPDRRFQRHLQIRELQVTAVDGDVAFHARLKLAPLRFRQNDRPNLRTATNRKVARPEQHFPSLLFLRVHSHKALGRAQRCLVDRLRVQRIAFTWANSGAGSRPVGRIGRWEPDVEAPFRGGRGRHLQDPVDDP